jgi:acetyl-CoA carboxylase alpha subunit
VRLGVHILETTDQAKDEDKKSFEQLTSWEKVKEAKEPKARGEEDFLSQG